MLIAPPLVFNAPAHWGLSRAGLGDLNTLADVIQRVEGYYPPSAQYPGGTLAWRNNNPGNLLYVGQPDASPGEGGSGRVPFARFPTYESGYNALKRQIQIQSDQGQTLSQFINQYAPPSDGNNTSRYLSTLETATGYTGADPLSAVIGGAAGSQWSNSDSAAAVDSGDSSGWTSALTADIGGGVPAWALAIPAALLLAFVLS